MLIVIFTLNFNTLPILSDETSSLNSQERLTLLGDMVISTKILDTDKEDNLTKVSLSFVPIFFEEGSLIQIKLNTENTTIEDAHINSELEIQNLKRTPRIVSFNANTRNATPRTDLYSTELFLSLYNSDVTTGLDQSQLLETVLYNQLVNVDIFVNNLFTQDTPSKLDNKFFNIGIDKYPYDSSKFSLELEFNHPVISSGLNIDPPENLIGNIEVDNPSIRDIFDKREISNHTILKDGEARVFIPRSQSITLNSKYDRILVIKLFLTYFLPVFYLLLGVITGDIIISIWNKILRPLGNISGNSKKAIIFVLTMLIEIRLYRFALLILQIQNYEQNRQWMRINERNQAIPTDPNTFNELATVGFIISSVTLLWKRNILNQGRPSLLLGYPTTTRFEIFLALSIFWFIFTIISKRYYYLTKLNILLTVLYLVCAGYKVAQYIWF